MKNLMLNMLEKWAENLEPYLRDAEESGVRYYGTGESMHWAVQSNMNVMAALAVLGKETGNEKWLNTALSLFRYAMRTHVTGDMAATNELQWGCHWISVLGAERMTHGVNALWDYMTGDDRERYRKFRVKESEWLRTEYPVMADISGKSGKNRPESNIWNGGFLLRTALDYPDEEHAEEYLDKGTAFLLNGISVPSDAENPAVYRGKPVSQWFAGANFTGEYSLDHHGYMNVGYSIICLSNLAMLHFNFREKNQPVPECLYHHVADLWKMLRNFFFGDGRLLRIGGDSRIRYTYCQAYTLPALLFIADVLKDPEAMLLAENYVRLMKLEQDDNASGFFYETRLKDLNAKSYFYYCRLESDPAAVLSQAISWMEQFPFPAAAESIAFEPAWHCKYHDASMIRTADTIRSFTLRGAQGPIALCVPADRSDLAEWQGNLLFAPEWNVEQPEPVFCNSQTGKDFFTAVSETIWKDAVPYGEAEDACSLLRSQSAVAALPDGRSMVVLERVRVLKENTILSFRSINYLVPNDVYNHHRRKYSGTDFSCETSGRRSEWRKETLDSHSRTLRVDDAVSLSLLYGADSLKIRREDCSIITVRYVSRLPSLYTEAICGDALTSPRRFRKGETLADTGVIVSTSADISGTAMKDTGENIRAVTVRDSAGVPYLFAANFGDTPEIYHGKEIPAKNAILEKLPEHSAE